MRQAIKSRAFVICHGCQVKFRGAFMSKYRKFCSEDCRLKFWRERQKPNCWVGIQADIGVARNTVGAAGELIVAVHLMAQGFHVFRALSPSCPCDLFVLKNGKSIAIEVRKGAEGQREEGTFCFNRKARDCADYYAVYLPDSVRFIKNSGDIPKRLSRSDTPTKLILE